MPRLIAKAESRLPPGAVELTAARTAESKIYVLPSGKRRAVAMLGAMHVPSDVLKWGRGESFEWNDLDTDIEPDGRGSYRVRMAWYGLEILPGVIGYSYISKRQGYAKVLLEALDGKPVGALPTPRLSGNEIWWDEVAPDLDIFIRCHADRVDIFKKLKSQNAPRALTWLIEESDPPILLMKTATAGHDNDDFLDGSRRGLRAGQIRRPIELVHEISEPEKVEGGRRFRATETWTGRTFTYVKGEPHPRPKIFHDGAVYPVLIDQDISETIANVSDDGYQLGATWFAQYQATGHSYISVGGGSGSYRPGFRFQTVAVPQGATIDLATLVLAVPGIGGDPTSGPLHGNDVDDAPAWANGAGPQNMTATTASVTLSVPDPQGVFETTVTTIIQEIVDRAGWASGNDMALGVQGTVTGNWKYIEDLNGGVGGAPILEIDYTEAGGGGEVIVAPPLIDLQGNLGHLRGNFQ